MRQRFSTSLLFLMIFLFCAVHVSSPNFERARGWLVSSFFPFWQKMGQVRSYWLDRPFFQKSRDTNFPLVYEERGFSSVLRRDPAAWSSTFWIERREGLEKNSPVLHKGMLVGVVELVEEKVARVRLITDAGCHVAVQVARGKCINRQILDALKELETVLQFREDLFGSPEEREFLFHQFAGLEKRLKEEGTEQYLARGEVFGSSEPLWRAKRQKLQGIGFFLGEEGPLISNVPFLQEEGPIVREGDLLVTSGLDGVFPPGIPVAYVEEVAPWKEGDFCYKLSARPAVFDLNKIQSVEVLPSLQRQDGIDSSVLP